MKMAFASFQALRQAQHRVQHASRSGRTAPQSCILMAIYIMLSSSILSSFAFSALLLTSLLLLRTCPNYTSLVGFPSSEKRPAASSVCQRAG